MKETRAEHLAVDKLRPFNGHPFKVVDNEEMDQLTWSILTQGLLTPLVVRPLDNGEYEVISGHRRLHACKKAGIETVPALIYAIDRDAAAIALVDSNLQREKILPSEKAFAYKMKIEAMGHRGKTCGQVGHKSRDALSSTESGRQIQRFIRLTELIPQLLDMVDEKKLAFNPAVEISYLSREEQAQLIEAMDFAQATPSLSQAQRLKKMSQEGACTLEAMCDVMNEVKKGELDRVTFKTDSLRKYFPKSYTSKQMEDKIIQLLEQWQKKQKRQMER